MNLLIIGSGAREHSFAWKIFHSKHDIKIFVTNPNPGISKISFCIDIDYNIPSSSNITNTSDIY